MEQMGQLKGKVRIKKEESIEVKPRTQRGSWGNILGQRYQGVQRRKGTEEKERVQENSKEVAWGRKEGEK